MAMKEKSYRKALLHLMLWQEDNRTQNVSVFIEYANFYVLISFTTSETAALYISIMIHKVDKTL